MAVQGYRRLQLEENLSVELVVEPHALGLDHDLEASDLILGATSGLICIARSSAADAVEMIGLGAHSPLNQLRKHPEASVREQAKIYFESLEAHDSDVFHYFQDDYTAPATTSSQSTVDLLDDALFGYNCFPAQFKRIAYPAMP